MSDCPKKKYFRPAIPTRVDGFLHDSKLEARVAEMLVRNDIEYLPHRTYNVVMRDGSIEEYTPDFVFRTPQKFVGIRPRILFLDVFGWPKPKHDDLKAALEYTHDCHGFIASQELIDKWCRCNLVKNETIPKGKPDR